MPNTNNNEKDTYLEILYLFGFISCIDKSTRVTLKPF